MTCLGQGFPDNSFGKEFAFNAGDPGSIPGSGRSAGEGIGYPLQYSWATFVAQLVKEFACNVEDLGLIPGLGKSPEERKGCPLQYSSLENSMDYTHGVTELDVTFTFFFMFGVINAMKKSKAGKGVEVMDIFCFCIFFLYIGFQRSPL